MAITLTSGAGISNDILSTTIYAIHPQVIEGLFQTTPFLSVSKQLKKIRTVDGSFKYVVPVETDEATQPTVLNTGWEALNLSITDFSSQAEYNYLRASQPVMISGREETENKGDHAIIKLAEARYKNAMSAFMRSINRQIVANGVAAFSQLGTLNGNTGTNAGGVSTGFLEANAVGSQTNTVGGLARTGVVGLQNQFVDAGAANLISNLYTIESRASTLLPSGGDGGRFHLTLASMDAWAAYRNALFAQERYIDVKSLDAAGVSSIAFSSGVMMPDRDMNFGQTSTTVENSFMLLNLDGIWLQVQDGADFSFTGFRDFSGYDGRYGQIIFQGALVAGHLGSSGLIVDAT